MGQSWFGLSTEGAPWDDEALDVADRDAGRPPALQSWFASWAGGFPLDEIARVTERGAYPVITWEPIGDKDIDPSFAPAQISQGLHDVYLREWAAGAARWCGPIFLRLAPEMNGDWANWGVGRNGNTAEDFVQMWRHIVKIFREEGAINVRWVWNPNIMFSGDTATLAEVYPGDEWVDWAGLDGYNWGDTRAWSQWSSFEETFGPSLEQLAGITRRPLMLGEIASAETGGDKAEWITDFIGAIRDIPQIRAWIWFNFDKEADWRFASSPGARDAFSAGVSQPWIVGGPIPVG